MTRFQTVLSVLALLASAPALAQSPSGSAPRTGLGRIGHIIVIFLENRSFDHLYGLFPGADGIGNAGLSAIQMTREGRPFITLPAVLYNRTEPARIDTRFGIGLPNRPFRADRYVSLEEATGDPIHRFYQEQEQIDDGKMDKFAAVSDAGGLCNGLSRRELAAAV